MAFSSLILRKRKDIIDDLFHMHSFLEERLLKKIWLDCEEVGDTMIHCLPNILKRKKLAFVLRNR